MKVRCLYCKNERYFSFIERFIINLMIRISKLVTKEYYEFLYYVDDNANCCKKPYYLEVYEK